MIKIKIFLGVDHQGAKYKNKIIKYLNDNGIEVETSILENNPVDDYPDFAFDICHKVLKNHTLGILVCGSGIGMSIAANKVKGIRAALCHETYTAKMSRQHNNANILAMGGRTTGPEIAKEIVRTWMTTEFEGGRHERRVNKIMALEQK